MGKRRKWYRGSRRGYRNQGEISGDLQKQSTPGGWVQNWGTLEHAEACHRILGLALVLFPVCSSGPPRMHLGHPLSSWIVGECGQVG